MRKYFSVQSLLWIALVLALVGSLRHVAHVFTSIDASVEWGWLQAVAIDAGLFALALGITQRRRVGRRTCSLWAGVMLFSAISIYANLAYGLEYAATLPVWVIVVKPYVLAASLPILVIYLAEIVGGNINYAQEVAAQEAQQAKEEAAPVAAVAKGKVKALLDFYAANPMATHDEAGKAIGLSRQRVGQRLAELEAAGVIHRNGGGVKILERN